MRLGWIFLSAGLLCAQQPKAEIQEVRATGCVRQARESQCLLLETLDGATIYTFTATPKPELGSVITIQGKSHEGRSACRQGIPVDVTDWEPTGDRCVEQQPKAK
jgi:hypothetical protein